MEELITAIKDLTTALAILTGVALGILITFYGCKMANWTSEYFHKKDLQKEELKKITKADKNDLMFYVRQEMRNFAYELKKEKDDGKEKDNM